MLEIKYKPIGIIHTPFKEPSGVPIQPAGSQGIAGTIEIEPEYIPCLKDLEGFSYIYLVYHFHLSGDYRAEVKPFMDETPRGVFATRAPRRPNSIGISIAKLNKIEEGTLHIEDVDMVDGTPLLDIKPFIPLVDNRHTEKIGWLTNRINKVFEMRADKRFC